MSIKQRIEVKFSSKYLFDADREAWRSLVSPIGEEVSGEKPPLVAISTLLGFVEISILCDAGTQAGRLTEVADAMKDSTVVEVVTENDKLFLRRKEWLKEEEDPARRTIFAKPVHVDSTEQQIRDFFGKYGTVQEVQLRTFVDAAGTKRRPSVYVTFASESEANKCIASSPSYGNLTTDLGSLFVPKLTVMTKRAHEEQAADDAEREHAQQQKKELVSAAAQQQNNQTGPFAGADHKKFLTPNRVCVIEAPPANATWDVIKSKLGGLSQDMPELAGKITLVKVDDMTKKAFVVTRTPRAAENLVLTFNRASGEYIEKIKTFAPNLRAATKEEDEYAIRKYTEWSKRKVDHKMDANQKKRFE